MMPVYLYNLKFKVITGVRIGTRGGETNELELLTIGDKYLIPATSLKGALRRVTEAIYGTKEHFEGHTSPSQGVIEKVMGDPELLSIAEAKGLVEDGKVKGGKEGELVRLYNEYNCPVEDLYGGTYFAGAVTIADYVVDASYFTRTHVSIDRKKGVSLQRHLFTEKILAVDAIYVRAIVRERKQSSVSTVEAWENTLKFLRDVGTFIGGGKSRGIGYIVLDEQESTFAKLTDLKERPNFTKLNLK